MSGDVNKALIAETLRKLEPDDETEERAPDRAPVGAQLAPAAPAIAPCLVRPRAPAIVRTETPAVRVERGAKCSICGERAICATATEGEFRACFACALSMAQLIASVRPASARPHGDECPCFECITFDEGQRGEIARVVLLDENGKPVSRWSLLEVK